MTDTTTATEELVISRVFDAPRDVVYRAFTDPDQLAQGSARSGTRCQGRRLTSTPERVGISASPWSTMPTRPKHRRSTPASPR